MVLRRQPQPSLVCQMSTKVDGVVSMFSMEMMDNAKETGLVPKMPLMQPGAWMNDLAFYVWNSSSLILQLSNIPKGQ